MKNEGEVATQLEIAFPTKMDTRPESFLEHPPDDVYIFPQGTKIYRSEGGSWGRISSGDRGKDVVAIDLTGKIRFQPKIHPFFLSLESSSIFVTGKGKHEQVGDNYVKFRASRQSGLKEPRRTEVWQSWCREMRDRGCNWDNLRDLALLKILQTS